MVFTTAIAIASLAPPVMAAPPEMGFGASLFVVNCSSSFCHGDGGVGARGPSLRNRNFPPDFVRNTMLQGRSGTPMPAFKDILGPAEVTALVGYVMSLSPGNHAQDDRTDAGAAAASAPLSEQASRGADIFFDPARPAGCAFCHSYQSKGGLVGDDLSGVAGKPPAAIYRSIVEPAAAYEWVTVTARDGHAVTGVERERNDQLVRLYDLSSVPPVLRTFYLSDGAKIEKPASAPLHRHDLTGYSKTEIADLIAFLKSAAGPATTLTPQDLGLQ